jgi:hypothetical protein
MRRRGNEGGGESEAAGPGDYGGSPAGTQARRSGPSRACSGPGRTPNAAVRAGDREDPSGTGFYSSGRQNRSELGSCRESSRGAPLAIPGTPPGGKAPARLARPYRPGNCDGARACALRPATICGGGSGDSGNTARQQCHAARTCAAGC